MPLLTPKCLILKLFLPSAVLLFNSLQELQKHNRLFFPPTLFLFQCPLCQGRALYTVLALQAQNAPLSTSSLSWGPSDLNSRPNLAISHQFHCHCSRTTYVLWDRNSLLCDLPLPFLPSSSSPNSDRIIRWKRKSDHIAPACLKPSNGLSGSLEQN